VVLGSVALIALYRYLFCGPVDRPDLREGTKYVLQEFGVTIVEYRMVVGEFPPADRDIIVSLREQGLMPYVLGSHTPPMKDEWGTPTRYEVSSNVVSLMSAGEDNRFGTTDDVTLTFHWPADTNEVNRRSSWLGEKLPRANGRL